MGVVTHTIHASVVTGVLRSDRTRLPAQTADKRYQDYCQWLGDCYAQGEQQTEADKLLVCEDGVWHVRDEPLALQQAARIGATVLDQTQAEVATSAREMLLVGMAAGVVDRTAVVTELNGKFTAATLKRKLTGAKMSLREYTTIEAAIARLRHRE